MPAPVEYERAASIDINDLLEFSYLRREGEELCIGAMARHRDVLADPIVRNKGTIGGSICQADPTEDLSAVFAALRATAVIRSSAGTRALSMDDFHVGPYSTAVEPAEMLVEVRIPIRAGSGSAYEKPALPLVPHWVGGKPSDGATDRFGDVYDPATGELARRSKILFAFREIVVERAAELAGIVTSEHGKVLSDALDEVSRAIEVIEFACGIPHLLKGGYSEEVSTQVDVDSIRQPLGAPASSARSASPPWSRAGSSLSLSRAATPSC